MWDITKPHKLQIEGRGALALKPTDHVATGGEGHVYRKGKLAVKVWDDPARAVTGRMPEKIRLLAALKHPMIVAPEALVLNETSQTVGYVMPWVDGSWGLPMAFTNDWRAAQGFGDAEALRFAHDMREVVTFVHGHDVIMGDANDLNILGLGQEPRYIDTDPWVMPGYPGDKIMPTVRDWHSGLFTKEADWFAWGVVSFQLLTGIHPYRGTHPDFKRTDIEGRMKANASVFDSKVRLPAAVRPLSTIPAGLLDWYKAAFVHGDRSIPPDPQRLQGQRPVAVPAPARQTAVGFVVTMAWALPGRPIRTVAPDILMLEGGTLVAQGDGRAYGLGDPDGHYMRLPDGGLAGMVAVTGMLFFGMVRPGQIFRPASSGLGAKAVWSAENRVFAVVDDGLVEVKVQAMASGPRALPGRKWSLNANATTFGDGVALYDALGAAHLVAPTSDGGVAIVRVRELDGMQPVAMIRRGRVAVLAMIDRQGRYHRATVLFTEAFDKTRIVLADADNGELPITITDSGVIVGFDASGDLLLEVPASGATKTGKAGAAAGGKLLAGPSGTYSAAVGSMYRLTVA